MDQEASPHQEGASESGGEGGKDEREHRVRLPSSLSTPHPPQ